MHSNNVFGAENQQERIAIAYWILGFTDGEGCFSIAAIRNATTRFGQQIFPEFVVTQSAKSLTALRTIQTFFGCGNICINKRHDNHKKDLCRYFVRSLDDLNNKIIPFFEEYRLKTHEDKDFIIFRQVVRMMLKKEHLNVSGRKKILKLINKMNSKKVRL